MERVLAIRIEQGQLTNVENLAAITVDTENIYQRAGFLVHEILKLLCTNGEFPTGDEALIATCSYGIPSTYIQTWKKVVVSHNLICFDLVGALR
jgi:hypothetical protein